MDTGIMVTFIVTSFSLGVRCFDASFTPFKSSLLPIYINSDEFLSMMNSRCVFSSYSIDTNQISKNGPIFLPDLATNEDLYWLDTR